MIAFQSPTTTLSAHDELAALLARNLTLGPVPVSRPDVSQVTEQQQQQHQQQPQEPKIVYSISQHYHHSAHIVKPSPAGEQQPPSLSDDAAEHVLLQNGIDVAALTPVQLALFKMSAPDRREYLLQLWRICPPATPAGGHEEVMSLDGTPVRVAGTAPLAAAAPAPSPGQSADSRWLLSCAQGYMEPYMAAGYEEDLMADGSSRVPRSRAALDPVYDNRLAAAPLAGRASWPQLHPAGTAEMENQYGTLMAMRDSEMEL